MSLQDCKEARKRKYTFPQADAIVSRLSRSRVTLSPALSLKKLGAVGGYLQSTVSCCQTLNC